MISLWQSDGTLIGRVRIKTRLADPLAAQQKIANLLGSAVMRQSRLPPSAVLCVRKMRDPLPGTRWLDGRRAHLGTEWEQAATQELDRLAASAAHPARAPVPASAAAVAFLDRAELLACLAQDWLAGTLRANWWWWLLLRSVEPDTAVIREWEDAPECVPAAIELLQRQSRAVECLRRLSESVAARLLTRMLVAHGIANAPIAKSLAAIEEPSDPIAERSPSTVLKVALEADPWLPGDPKALGADPWLPWVPEASAGGLSPSARLLLAYALLLRRAPEVARAAWFAERLESRRAGPSVAGQERSDLSPGSLDRSQSEIPAAPPDADSPMPTAPRPLASFSDEPAITSLRQNGPAPDGPLADPPTPLPEPRQGAADAETRLPDGRLRDSWGELPTAAEQAAAQSIAPESVAVREERPGTAAASALSAAVDTAYGGAFFLLNVALYLGLYGDFANPLHPGLELNIWDFLALFGCEFAGDDFRADPVWALLADLAGRRIFEPPGANFRAPDAWRLPAEWLDQFSQTETLRAAVAGERLAVTHPAAFRVVDVPLAGRTPQQALAEEMEPYSAGVSAIEEVTGMAERPPLVRWTGWMAGYLLARLARAIGRDDGAALLCRVPARVRITPAHVHVFLRLEGYPVEIRLAGLDRDPGWIPAAGRYVGFNFD